MWSKNNATLAYFDPDIFIGKTSDEKKVCAFALALALYFNDSKNLIGLKIAVIDGKPTFNNICEELGEYSAVDVYLTRLILSHLHELHYIVTQNLKSVEQADLHRRILSAMHKKGRLEWDRLVGMVNHSDRNPINQLVQNIRNSLGYHYVQQKELYAGYLSWREDIRPGKRLEKRRFRVQHG